MKFTAKGVVLKSKKVIFNTLWRFGVMDKNPRGGGGSGSIPPS